MATTTITIFATGANAHEAVEGGMFWDSLADAKEYAYENDVNDVRVYRLQIPVSSMAATLVPVHSPQEARELADRIPAEVRAQALQDSVDAYGFEK